MRSQGGAAISDSEEFRDRSVLILVVERDPHVRELERYFLEEAGFSVRFAEDGDEALAMARSMRPYLVITEVLVPRMDGLALCREIRKDDRLRETEVLVFSILSAAERAQEAGACAFLRKPLAERSLLSTVREILSKHEHPA
jgi:DNA-binding response OmpR family regulator